MTTGVAEIAAPTSRPGRGRRFWVLLIIGLAIALALFGVGLGWLLFGRPRREGYL